VSEQNKIVFILILLVTIISNSQRGSKAFNRLTVAKSTQAKVSPKKKEHFQKLKQEEIYLRCSDNLGVTVFHPQHQQAYLKHIQFFAFPE
jgi:hypothetical protein